MLLLLRLIHLSYFMRKKKKKMNEQKNHTPNERLFLHKTDRRGKEK